MTTAVRQEAEPRRLASLDVARLLERRRTENFPVASMWIPRAQRELLLAVYAYARFVDEIGDCGLPGALAALDAVEHDIRVGPAGPRRVPALAPVLWTLQSNGLPAEPLVDLLEANRQDQRVSRYATFGDLLGYCRLSANPVGRLVLCVMGVNRPSAQSLSDAVCSALQIVEHLQDVREDALRGRIYLPAEDMDRYGVAEAALRSSRPATTGLRQLVALEAGRARDMLVSGSALVGMLRGWRRAAVAGYVGGGMAALHGLETAGWDVTAGGAIRAGAVRRLAATVPVLVRGGAT